ncbi:S1 RNA-binding domain-containing protein [Streptomyces sp. NPDC056529]|uniref:S1 RNA-binding domain-containing protein n=1 Tax=Streptomyces sp. NPDC056529 TaxID=3345855 RepID=UPI0036C66A73
MRPGEVTELIPFGVFVRVADGIEGLVHVDDLDLAPGAVLQDVAAVGDRMTVVVTDVDLVRRRVRLAPVRPDRQV